MPTRSTSSSPWRVDWRGLRSPRRTRRCSANSSSATDHSPSSTYPRGRRSEHLTTASFHFHGYQPGDLVRWAEPDPFKPPKFEERRSAVSLTIGGERVRGRNWTDAVLHAYGRMESVLERAAGAASVDIEPQTLAWLAETDEVAYRRVLAAYEKGNAGFAITPPFHPILPHHHRLDREILFQMMFDFFSPLLSGNRRRPIGLW